MITTKQLLECDLTHKHAGNGFVMVEDLDKEYCRVSTYSAGTIDGLVRLAAKDRLTAGIPIEERLPPKLSKIRTGIRTGKLKVEKNRVVKA